MNAETNFTQSTRFWAVLIFPTDKMSIDSDTRTLGQNADIFLSRAMSK